MALHSENMLADPAELQEAHLRLVQSGPVDVRV